jgi:RNA polymerase sigma-70 factor (ECF subfamily)
MDTAQLYETYKPMLFSVAYRMTGTVTDAEDIVQDTFVSLERDERSDVVNVKAYLYKILVNRCIDYLKSARRRRETYVGPWLPEPLVISENDPLQTVLSHESLSVAYLLLMEKLTPIERAVFILREVLDFGYSEIAEMVGKKEENCRKILSLAKRKLGGPPSESAGSYEADQSRLNEFIEAVYTGNSAVLLELLAEDVVLYSDGGGKVKAALHPIRTRDHVLRFLQGLLKLAPADLRLRWVNLNGSPGLVAFSEQEPDSAVSFQIREGRIEAIYIIRNPDKLRHLKV